MKLFRFVAIAAVCAFFLTGCGGQAGHGDNPTKETETEAAQSEPEREESVVLTERQKEILSGLGLSTDYEKLSDREKSAITAIEYMLSYLEDKYGEKFVYSGYVDGRSGLEKEHLTAYPESGSMKDEVTVYRTYADGTYNCTDDYINILAGPVYHAALEKYISNFFTGGSLFTEVSYTSSDELPTEETVLYSVAAHGTLLLDEAVVDKTKVDTFVKDYSAMMQAGGKGMPSALGIMLTNAETIKGINDYNYHDKLSQAEYSYLLTISVSSSGDVTLSESES